MKKKVFLSESQLHNVISEAVNRILEEQADFAKLKDIAEREAKRRMENGIPDEVGTKGPLKLERGNVNIYDGKCHLVAMSDIFGEPSRVKPGSNWFKKEHEDVIRNVYDNYANSMRSHHPEGVQHFDHMANAMMNRRYAFTNGRSFVFMFDQGTARKGLGATGYWTVSHFAPESNRDGYMLLKELFKYDNIIVAVTEHMWEQLVKMGLSYPEITHDMEFAGEKSEKMFFTTDKKLLESEFVKSIIEDFKTNGTPQDKAELIGRVMRTPGLYKEIAKRKFQLAKNRYLKK